MGNCVCKILAFRPNVLITGGGIANIALAMLVKAAIAIFSNVKRSVLARVAASTGAEVISSMDAFLSGSYDIGSKRRASPIGICQWYRSLVVPQPNGTEKALCIFSLTDLPAAEAPQPVNWFQIPGVNLVSSGAIEESVEDEARSLRSPMYSLILRGPDLAALKLAKRCIKLAMLAAFNARLELAYLNDAEMVLTGDPLNSLENEQLEDSFPSTLAQHLANRVLNLSPLTAVKLPFLATSEGRHVPLFSIYHHFAAWTVKRRLNDALKQKAVAMRARVYAAEKLSTKHAWTPSKQPQSIVKEDGGKRFLRRWAGKSGILAMMSGANNKPIEGSSVAKSSQVIKVKF